MTSAFGGLLQSLGCVAQSVSRLAPSVLPGVGVGVGVGARTAPPSSTATWTPSVTQVRHRYYSEKLEKGPLLRNYGYNDYLYHKGLLPHMKHNKRLPIPVYRPKNLWAEKRALFGQNDYIDILGDGTLKPTNVAYSVPPWLRGFKGNEYQMLLRKRKMFGNTMRLYRPTKFQEMNKRIKYLYRFLNQKTRDYYWDKA